MTAVIGFDRDQLESLVNGTEGVVIANDNSAAQVVISGTPEAVNSVSEQLTCKRAIPLAVSGAFHSPLMAEAAAAFKVHLQSLAFQDARFPVLSNTDPTPCSDAAELKQRLSQQMTTGVRWRETMDKLTSAGVETLIEVGPGNVLSGLAKRAMTGVTTAQLSSSPDLGH